MTAALAGLFAMLASLGGAGCSRPATTPEEVLQRLREEKAPVFNCAEVANFGGAYGMADEASRKAIMNLLVETLRREVAPYYIEGIEDLADIVFRKHAAAAEAIEEIALGLELSPAVAEQLIPPLAKALFEGWPNVDSATARENCARALGAIGTGAGRKSLPIIVPLLKQALTSANVGVCCKASYALGRIGKAAPETRAEIVPALLNAFNSAAAAARRKGEWSSLWEAEMVVAAIMLGEIGPAAKEGVPALEEMLGHKNQLMRISAAGALWRITGKAEKAWPVLEAALRDKIKFVRMGAADELGRVGPAAKEAVPALEEMLGHKNQLMRISAAGALWRITGEAEKAWPVLEAGLEDKTELYMGHLSVRWCAAAALHGIGPAAARAIPALERLAKDPKRDVRMAAKVALVEIRGAGVPAGELSRPSPSPAAPASR